MSLRTSCPLCCQLLLTPNPTSPWGLVPQWALVPGWVAKGGSADLSMLDGALHLAAKYGVDVWDIRCAFILQLAAEASAQETSGSLLGQGRAASQVEELLRQPSRLLGALRLQLPAATGTDHAHLAILATLASLAQEAGSLPQYCIFALSALQSLSSPLLWLGLTLPADPRRWQQRRRLQAT